MLMFVLTGDVLLLECNALYTVKKWPGFYSRLQKISYKSDFHVKKYDGSWIVSWPFGDGEDESLTFNRNELHEQLCSYVQELGIQLDHSTNVEQYFETEERRELLFSVTGRRSRRILWSRQMGSGPSRGHLF